MPILLSFSGDDWHVGVYYTSDNDNTMEAVGASFFGDAEKRSGAVHTADALHAGDDVIFTVFFSLNPIIG